jgi:DNA repair exonuclease SbcCD ATPase subunit
MQKLSEVKNRYNEKLKEYQMYYIDSVVGSDRKIKNQMKKKADEVSIPLKYYEAEVRTIESLINWLEGNIKSYNDSVTNLYEIQADPQRAKKIYGSLRNVKEAIISESSKRVALENLLTYLKS